jgi:hypothetical protein
VRYTQAAFYDSLYGDRPKLFFIVTGETMTVTETTAETRRLFSAETETVTINCYEQLLAAGRETGCTLGLMAVADPQVAMAH